LIQIPAFVSLPIAARVEHLRTIALPNRAKIGSGQGWRRDFFRRHWSIALCHSA
jgi:hypothetical protein